MTGEGLDWQRLGNPVSTDYLIICGFCFGYPVAATAARITGAYG